MWVMKLSLKMLAGIGDKILVNPMAMKSWEAVVLKKWRKGLEKEQRKGVIDGFTFAPSMDSAFFELRFATREKMEAYKKQVEKEFHIQEGRTHGIMKRFMSLVIDDIFEVVD